MVSLLKYSTRIRELQLWSNPGFTQMYEQTERLSSYTLFPHLQALTFGSAGPEIDFVTRTMGNALLAVKALHYSAVPPQALDTIASKSPYLSSIELLLHFHQIVPEVSSSLLKLLSVSKNLADFGVASHSCDEIIWHAATQVPCLKRLTVDHITQFSNTPVKATFSTLVDLELCISTLSLATTVLQRARFPRLQKFQFIDWTAGQYPQEEIFAFLRALVCACNSATLATLEMYYNEGANHFVRAAPVQSEALRPLLALTNLQRLHLEPGWDWDVDDSLVLDMGKAWPHLRYLYLDPGRSWKSERITFGALEQLAAMCPHLEVFGAVINSTLPSAPRRSSTRNEHLVLRQLRLGATSIGSAVRVAAYLSSLYPSLETVSGFDFEPMDEVETMWRERWERVEELVPVMVQVRKTEREVMRNLTC